jgi:pyrroloquinoline quinone (PQQ) biosynthesis protein C
MKIKVAGSGAGETPAAQQRALDILCLKLDMLWSMLDAIEKG